MSDEWGFLDERFRALRGAVRVHDPSPFVANQASVRLGRDDDELWISVRVHSDQAKTAAQRQAHCRALHEALVLTSIVAAVDYDAWRRALQLTSELAVPPAVDPDATPRRLHPQYRIELPTESKFDWKSVKQILAGEEHSVSFEEQYTLATEAATRHGCRLDQDVLFRVCVYDCPIGASRRQQLTRLQDATETIVSLGELGVQSGPQAVLRLDSIDLSLQNFHIHSSVFGEILTILETGVQVKSLGLPFNFPEDEGADDAARYKMWSLLVSAICGRPQRPTRGPVCVQHLVLSSPYDFPEMLVQLFSVLREERTLKSLSVSASSLRGDPSSFFWLWLGYALFRPDSNCSVEVLDLDMVDLSPSAITNLRDTMTTPDPLHVLWQKTTQTREVQPPAPATRPTVVVPAGTTVRPYGDDPDAFLQNFVVPVDWSGVVVHDDSAETTVDALLHGIGFCEIDRAALSNKRQRMGTSSTITTETSISSYHKIHTLMLGMYTNQELDDTTPRVHDLLGLVGGPLTALSISDPDVDDPRLDQCLQQCPRLQSLRLEGVRLTSLDPIVQSYNRGGEISTLELSAIAVEQAFLPRFEGFLTELLTPNSAIKRTLKKLRVGHQWASLFRQSTANVIKNVLNDSLTLDYLHVYRCENPRVAPPIDWDIANHQGELIPVAGTPSLELRVAFAGVVQHLRTHEKFARLNNYMLASVFEYVGRTKKRVVISEASTYYNSRMFGVRIAQG